jgi:hypothetical protein
MTIQDGHWTADPAPAYDGQGYATVRTDEAVSYAPYTASHCLRFTPITAQGVKGYRLDEVPVGDVYVLRGDQSFGQRRKKADPAKKSKRKQTKRSRLKNRKK